MSRRKFSDKICEYSGDIIISSVFIGAAAGLIPVIFAAVCYSIDFDIFIIGILLLVPMIMLLQNREPVLCILRSAAAFTSYLIFLPLMLFSGGFNYLFTLFNPDYGKPNAGDGFGLIYLMIPASAVLLLISIIGAGIICFIHWLKNKEK